MSMKAHESDTEISAWFDQVVDPRVTELFRAVVRHLRARGFTVGDDPTIQHRSLRDTHRLGRLGALQVAVERSGRVVRAQFFQDVVRENKNGGRYDFDKRARMPYLIRLRYEAEVRALQQLFAGMGYTLEREPPKLRGMAFVEAERAELIRFHGPRMYVDRSAYNCRSADGSLLQDGQQVWWRGRDGRVRTGQAWAHINSMWWLSMPGGEVANVGSHDLMTQRPPVLRGRWFTAQHVRGRLVDEKAKAVRSEQFERAAMLRDVLARSMGEALFHVWSKEKRLWWRPAGRGYAADRMDAGLFTAAECERILRGAADLQAIPANGAEAKAA